MQTYKETDNSICVVGDFEQLCRIREFVGEKAKEFGFSAEEAYKIALAVDEACSNLIRHAYRMDSSKYIRVMIETGSDEFTVDVQDSGVPFNPLCVSSPEMEAYFKQFKRGGLGIHIMRSVMDEITYTPSEGGCAPNTLRLKKIKHAV